MLSIDGYNEILDCIASNLKKPISDKVFKMIVVNSFERVISYP